MKTADFIKGKRDLFMTGNSTANINRLSNYARQVAEGHLFGTVCRSSK